ncbi:hypothetical protein [Lysinibacillus sp. 54212]|uniref:hypothetical protein n=1 Tax=Lysinibacillus sp. 54212 TaxID=3119829 RepID=UPI002FC582D3
MTGEKAKAYTEVRFPVKRPLTEEEYKNTHEVGVPIMLQSQTKIDAAYFKPISVEEYEAQTADDE